MKKSLEGAYLAPYSSRPCPPRGSCRGHRPDHPHNRSPCHSHHLLFCKGLFPLRCSTLHYLPFATWHHFAAHIHEGRLKCEKHCTIVEIKDSKHKWRVIWRVIAAFIRRRMILVFHHFLWASADRPSESLDHNWPPPSRKLYQLSINKGQEDIGTHVIEVT